MEQLFSLEKAVTFFSENVNSCFKNLPPTKFALGSTTKI